MRMIAATAFAAALLGAATDARADEVSYQLWIDNTPPSIVESATRAGIWKNHRLRSAPTPYLRGDLDGDGRVDDIIQVARRTGGQPSLVVLWGQRKKTPTWLALHEPPTGTAATGTSPRAPARRRVKSSSSPIPLQRRSPGTARSCWRPPSRSPHPSTAANSPSTNDARPRLNPAAPPPDARWPA